MGKRPRHSLKASDGLQESPAQLGVGVRRPPWCCVVQTLKVTCTCNCVRPESVPVTGVSPPSWRLASVLFLCCQSAQCDFYHFKGFQEIKKHRKRTWRA